MRRSFSNSGDAASVCGGADFAAPNDLVIGGDDELGRIQIDHPAQLDLDLKVVRGRLA